jgi:yjeF C-terminal region, hydroxyethylthiazole kinase-related
MHGAYPILSCEEAKAFEADYFGGDEAREWPAMQAAGRGVARGIREDFAEIGPWPEAARVLVLAGKGHNAGDALIAATELQRCRDGVAVDVVFVFGERGLRPLARRAWADLETKARVLSPDARAEWAPGYDVIIDGVFGFQFRPPLDAAAAAVLARANATPARLRAAVDMPSGLGEPPAFRADFTYATGIVKAPLLELPNAGRLRFIDLGFPLNGVAHTRHVLGGRVLDPLHGLRAPHGDKRHFGHPLIVAGSRRYPGAALMATLAALRGGAGLVTAAVPETLVPAFAAQVPEAIWLGLPETPDGGLALEGLHLVREAFGRASAVVLGPGMGGERETRTFAQEIARESPRPLVIDADALQPEIVAAGEAARILTPHAGEYARIAEAIPSGAVVVRKGPITRIETVGADGRGGEDAGATTYHSFFGGPVLARGGSGDLLAGLAGTLLAQTPGDPLGAAARAVVWHGRAADAVARVHGPTAVRTTQLLDFLPAVLRACGE